jgi:hypothetical protein
MSYGSIEWLPLTLGLTIVGVLLSYLTYRRRGLRPAMMVTAWSLLPIAAYLTGATEMLWKIGAAIGKFGTDFVFSPEKWAGIGVTGLAVALFLAAGGRTRRRASREARKAARADRGKAEAEGSPAPALGKARTTPGTQILPTERQRVPADRATAPTSAKGSRKAAAPDDDDMKDIEDILRKRGI